MRFELRCIVRTSSPIKNPKFHPFPIRQITSVQSLGILHPQTHCRGSTIFQCLVCRNAAFRSVSTCSRLLHYISNPTCFSNVNNPIFFSSPSLVSFRMVADAVIYHPTVSHYLKYVATSGTLYIPWPRTKLSWILALYAPSRKVRIE